jgi:glycerophosphoryl diester phosphodiesterase
MIEVTGHRGVSGLKPENTISGFKYAVKLGCHTVELDVRLTHDHKLAVIHDKFLERTTNGEGPVESYTMKELKQFDAGAGERIPELCDVLDVLTETDLKIQIELKGEGTEDLAPEYVRMRGLWKRVIFTSFFHKRVLKVHQKLPAVTTGILIICNPVDPIGLLNSSNADNLHVSYERINLRLVNEVHAGGKKIVAFGRIEEIEVIDRLIDLGVDVIGSDRPDIVLDRLRSISKPNKSQS